MGEVNGTEFLGVIIDNKTGMASLIVLLKETLV